MLGMLCSRHGAVGEWRRCPAFRGLRKQSKEKKGESREKEKQEEWKGERAQGRGRCEGQVGSIYLQNITNIDKGVSSHGPIS